MKTAKFDLKRRFNDSCKFPTLNIKCVRSPDEDVQSVYLPEHQEERGHAGGGRLPAAHRWQLGGSSAPLILHVQVGCLVCPALPLRLSGCTVAPAALQRLRRKFHLTGRQVSAVVTFPPSALSRRLSLRSPPLVCGRMMSS